MKLISKCNKGFRFLLCAVAIYSKYAYGNLLKDKNVFIITNAFQNFLEESNCKPNEIWADQGSEFYDTSMKSWLEKNDVKMHSTHNEGKPLLQKDSLEPSKIKFMNTWL